MLRFFAIRLVRAIVTLLICVSVVFLLLRGAGDPASIMLPSETPDDVRQAYRELWGLDRPLWEQYLYYLVDVLHGNLGVSFADGRPAADIVLETVPKSLLLGSTALIIALLIGIPLGILAARRHNSRIDRLVMSIAVFGYATPVFFLGILMILWFALSLRVLPAAGSSTWAHLVMPALTLALPLAGRLARFARTAALEVLGKPFIRTARAKGVGGVMVILFHVVPNAAVPVLMYLGIEIGGLMAGGAVTETIFAWPGIGRLLVSSAATRDLPVVQAAILMATLIMVISNLLADLLHAAVDPRLSLGSGSLTRSR